MAHLAYRLQPKPGGGFHLGREGLEQEVSAETFPSDSLFAALIATFAQLEGAAATAAFLAEWPQPGINAVPPFRVATLFPYVGQIPLLPMPRLRVNLADKNRQGAGKALKKLAFVSPGILALLLTGQSMDDWLPQKPGLGKHGLLLHEGKVWLTLDEIAGLPEQLQCRPPETLFEVKLWDTTPVPRVAIDRVSSSSSIYHVGRTTFRDDCGLWLLADVERDQTVLETLLVHLGDTGIGGERSAGYGGFTPQAMTPPDLPSVKGAPRVMTLSRYSPTLSELEVGILGENASYELVDVGGWLATPNGKAQRRKRLRMIEAGSILEATTTITGQIVDVRPEYPQEGAPSHPVYRGGVALTVGVTGGNDG